MGTHVTGEFHHGQGLICTDYRGGFCAGEYSFFFFAEAAELHLHQKAI
jgi:hypothetical protein